MLRSINGVLVLVATVVAAIVIGFGVPLLWVWIGSQLQGGSGATTLSFSVAVAILAGIILTYVLVLYVAGWLMNRFEGGSSTDRRTGRPRDPWMRSQSDTRGAGSEGPSMSAVERVFVVTTLIVTGAAWFWFLFLAEGGGLPNP